MHCQDTEMHLKIVIMQSKLLNIAILCCHYGCFQGKKNHDSKKYDFAAILAVCQQMEEFH